MSNIIIVGRVVVCAACKYSTVIVAGARHYDSVMRGQLNAMDVDELKLLKSEGQVIQGFIDQRGIFMDRKEALEVATTAGQINTGTRKTWPEYELFSEGLY